MSIIKDIKLAPEGANKIDWISRHMPVLNSLRTEFKKTKPFKGYNIVLCLHLEAKTACLCLLLAEGGARVVIAGSNPLSTQDDIAAALVDKGVNVFSWYNATEKEYNNFLEAALEEGKPHFIIDDGGDLVSMIHRDPGNKDYANIIGGAEETTTGLIRLHAMDREGALNFPMLAVNDAYCKYLFDNRYGTGQSVWDGIIRTTNLLIAGKNVVVAGYGWCGKGVALRARGLGAHVIVAEVNPIKALEAIMDGYKVMPLTDAAAIGDIFITLTGCAGVIGYKHIEKMKDGALLCNAGHFDVEVDLKKIEEKALEKRLIKKNITEYRFAHKSIFVLAEGRLVNLSAADGHPAEIMDLSFSIQALAVDYLRKNQGLLPAKVIPTPYEIDEKVARIKLETLGVGIDALSDKQVKYLSSWKNEKE